MKILFPKQKNTVTAFSDGYAERLCSQYLITKEQLISYQEEVCSAFSSKDSHNEKGAEQVYRLICRIRRQALGADVLERARELDRSRPKLYTNAQGICEEAQKTRLFASGTDAVFVLYQAEFFSQMYQDIVKARECGHRVYLLTSPESGNALPTEEVYRRWLGNMAGIRYLESCPVNLDSALGSVRWDGELQAAIDDHHAVVFAYGEEGILACRSLRTDAIVTAIPQGYYAKAITNQLGCEACCTVYVPSHLDITTFVPLTEKTQLSYWHLAMLREKFSTGIDDCSVEELYRRYPNCFLNRYENGTDCPEYEKDFPIQVSIPAEDADPVGNFDQYREEAIAEYFNGLKDQHYRCAYFDPQLNRIPVPWNAKTPQEGILVHSVRVKRAEGSKIIGCGNGTTLRRKLHKEEPEGNGILSNFLFFLTPKLASLYNSLRQDRPRECAQLGAMHLDYMLCTENGVRKETFPLFRKTCIAMKKSGEFLFFNFRLGGGKIRIGSQWITWVTENVDPVAPGSICIYTPYASVPDGEADRQTYRKTVGAGRINMVLLQDRIHCIRRGDVVLPSVGVVLSFDEGMGEVLLKDIQAVPVENGYYTPSDAQVELCLDPPAGVAPEEWAQIQWAYGGGLSLILAHRAVSDTENMFNWFEEEGWMSPLSRQTQESVQPSALQIMETCSFWCFPEEPDFQPVRTI